MSAVLNNKNRLTHINNEHSLPIYFGNQQIYSSFKITRYAIEKIIKHYVYQIDSNLIILNIYFWTHHEIYNHLEIIADFSNCKESAISLVKKMKYRISQMLYKHLKINLYNLAVQF